MFVAFYLIIGACAAFGLIQAAGPNTPPRPPVRPTPPATPTPRSTTGNSPNRTGSSQTPTTGQGATPPPAPAAAANDGTQSVNLFNDQVWLMDLFSEEGSNIGRFPEPITNSNNVPKNVPLPQLNNFLQVENDAIFNWLQQLTPHEYAQLTPAIRLSVVNLASQEQVDIPLSSNSDIEKGLATDYWYTNNTVGLKSFSMKLDGNNNPVGGKIYNVKLNLLFDSANTFFDRVPGLPGLAYSDILRVQGPAGAASNDFKLKLSVYYDGPAELVQKYRLNSPGQVFSSYLTLIMSSFDMDENYQTEVEAKFIGYEESLFSNAELFDWLRIDLAAKIEEIEKGVRDAQTARDTELRSIEEARAKRLSEIGPDALAPRGQQPSPEGSLTRLDVARAGFANTTELQLQALRASRSETRNFETLPAGATIEIDGNAVAAAPIVIAQQQKQYEILQAGIGGAEQLGVTVVKPAGLNFDKPFSELTATERLAIGAYVDSGEFMNQQMRNSLQSSIESNIREGKPLGSVGVTEASCGVPTFNKTFLGGTGGFAQLSTNVQRIGTSGSRSLNMRKEAAERMFREAEQRAIGQRENARMTEIRKALEETIFAPNGQLTEFYKFEVTAQQVQNYIFNINSLTSTDFLLNTVGDRTPTRGGESHSKPSDTNIVRSGTEQSEAANAKLVRETETLRNQISTLEQQITDQASIQSQRNRTGTNAAAGTIGAARESGEAGARASREQEVNRLRSQLQRKEAELGNLNKNLSRIGSIAELEQKLNEFKFIEFVYLGDLVSMIMNRLNSLGSDVTRAQKLALQKTLVLLTRMKLKRSNGNYWDAPLYKFPISLVQLQKLLADKLYGTGKNSYTIFEFISDLTERIITLAMKRKARLTHSANVSSTSFSLKFIPVPLLTGGSTGYKIASDKDKDEPRLKHGIITIPRDNAQGNYSGSDEAGNLSSKIPHIYMGGQAKGALKAVKVAEIEDSSMQKVSMERSRGSDTEGVIPLFFKSELTLVGTPFFHLGTYYFLDPVGLAVGGRQSSWFHLKGHYSVIELEHSYSISTGYQTVVKGIFSPRHSGRKPTANTLSAADANRSLT